MRFRRGSPGYVAPEITFSRHYYPAVYTVGELQGQMRLADYQAADWFSAGLTLASVVIGIHLSHEWEEFRPADLAGGVDALLARFSALERKLEPYQASDPRSLPDRLDALLLRNRLPPIRQLLSFDPAERRAIDPLLSARFPPPARTRVSTPA